MKRAAPLFVLLLPLIATTATLGAACSEDATAGPAADAGGDRRSARPAPTAEEDEEDAVACARADAAGVDPPPADYRARQNPLTVTNDVVAAGAARFGARCVLCHGDEGNGDGQEGPFEPPPANFTLQRRSDAYLFWRISEGGASPPFCSAMPAFEGLYTETQRWELVAFIQETFAPKLDGGSDAADAD